jgi:hypothetical protein
LPKPECRSAFDLAHAKSKAGFELERILFEGTISVLFDSDNVDCMTSIGYTELVDYLGIDYFCTTDEVGTYWTGESFAMSSRKATLILHFRVTQILNATLATDAFKS